MERASGAVVGRFEGRLGTVGSGTRTHSTNPSSAHATSLIPLPLAHSFVSITALRCSPSPSFLPFCIYSKGVQGIKRIGQTQSGTHQSEHPTLSAAASFRCIKPPTAASTIHPPPSRSPLQFHCSFSALLSTNLLGHRLQFFFKDHPYRVFFTVQDAEGGAAAGAVRRHPVIVDRRPTVGFSLASPL